MKNPGSATAAAITATLLALALFVPEGRGQSLDFLQKIGSDIDIKGLNQEWNPETEVASVMGDVRIAYEGVVIKAKRAEYHTKTGDIKAYEDVVVFQGGSLFRGDSVTYNTQTGILSSDGLRSRTSDLVFKTENFRMDSEAGSVIEGTQAMFTTHDHVVPNYRIESKKLEIFPEKKVVVKGSKFYTGKVPIFWLPRFTQPLEDELGYFLVPGYNSRWGGFLNNRYGVLHGDHTVGQYHLDLRTGRGIGVGADYFSEKFRDNPNLGKLKLYYSYDIDTEFDKQSTERAELSENRYRINFQHRIYFPGPEEGTFYLDFDINKVSDRLYYQDFFFSDARTDPSPDNLLNFVKRGDRYEASLLTRFQLNDFTSQDTRLPEFAVDFTTQQLGNTPFFYRGSSSWGILGLELSEKEKAAKERERDSLGNQISLAEDELVEDVDVNALAREIDRLKGFIDGSGYQRLYSYHEVLFPTQLGPINFVPRLGGGVLYYSEIENSAGSDSLDRGIFHAGFDLSTKWTKEFDDLQAPKLGLDGLRHIVQPYMNYSYVHADEIGEGRLDPRIDGGITSTKPRPIDVPLFSSIDSIEPWNIVRVGVRHTLQTRRDEKNLREKKTYSWLTFDTYLDSYIDDPEFDRDFSNVHNYISWRPVPWFKLEVDSQFPIDDNPENFSELNTDVSWTPHDRLNLSFSHALLQDHPVFVDSSRFSFSSFLRLSENWGFSTSHSFEAEEGELESQSYRVHRDLTSWMGSLGVVHINNVGAEDEIGFVLAFTLKEFPSITMPFDLNPNPTQSR